MNSELWEMILKIVLSVVGTIVSTASIWLLKAYVVPYLKTKLGETQYYTLLEKLRMYMSSAEKKFGNSEGKAKSAWVVEQILNFFPKLDKDYVQALIDGMMQPLENEGIVNVVKKEA